VLWSVSVVNRPTTVLLLRYCSKYPTWASRDTVVFRWVPGHRGLGNEATDAVAKAAAMHGPLISDAVLGSDVCSCLRRSILSLWQA
jgi:hypothetical protein